MGQVARYDAVEVRKPERTPQGFLRADAVLTRAGVFTYRNPDGTTRREYRPPEEVFKADSLASFEDAPITVEHPARLIDAKTVREHAVGSVKEAPRRDGDVAVARIVVMDASAIGDVESGRRRAVSCGYQCDYDPTPGVTPTGERYDGVQTNIRGNHLALVTAGRAGPEARVRLDAADAVQVTELAGTNQPTQQTLNLPERTMAKIRIDGVDFEASEQLAQALAVAQDKTQKRLDELEAKTKSAASELEKATARADAAQDEAKKAKAEREDALKKLPKLVKARAELERTATKVLGTETKLDSLTDAQVKRAVVEKLYPESKTRLDGAGEEYLQARFDAALEALESKGNEALGALRVAAGASGARNDADERIAKARAETANAWQQPLAASKDARS